MDWLANLVNAIVWFAVGAMFWPRIKERIERPYRFKCPALGCHFVVTTNQKSVTDDMTTSHMATFHKE